MPAAEVDHYATLGLDRRCTAEQIRVAYRELARRHHPDLNPGSAEALVRSQEINAAHEVLGDPARRAAYDRECDAQSRAAAPGRKSRRDLDLAQAVMLRIEDFFRGATVDVRVKDPGNPLGPETYTLTVPPDTAPGAVFRLPRPASAGGGVVKLTLKPLPGFRFKASGSDLRADLRISTQRASSGGVETMPGPDGRPIAIAIPAGVARGERIRVPRVGLPKARGGRGELIVRISYRPEVRVTRR